MTEQNAERRAVLIAATMAVPLALLTLMVTTHWSPLETFDHDVSSSWYGWALSSSWIHVFWWVSAIFDPIWVRLAMLLLAGLFALRRQLLNAAWVSVVVVATGPLNGLYKVLVDRPRPHVPDQISGWSFPSGHSSEIAAAAGVLLVVLWGRSRPGWRRQAATVVLVGLAGLVGLSRVMVGAHYPSDVAAGWLLGTLIVFLASAVFGLIDTSPATPVAAPLSSLPARQGTLAVIVNPIRIADLAAFQRHVSRAAREAGWDEPLWFETTVDDAGGSMSRAAVAAGADMVIVAGGDGTVRVVCGEMAGTGVPVGVIPAGTGNLLARNLDIPLQQDQALAVALHGQDRAVDVVRIQGDRLAETRFVVMAGLGLDAAIMDGAPEQLKKRLGWTAYVYAAGKHLRYPAVRVDISLDGNPPVRRRARTVVIGNVGSLQAGIPLLPDAEIDDGVLDVVVIAPRQLLGWVGLVWRVMTRQKRTDDRLDRFTGRSVTVTAASPTPRQLDGDTVGAGTSLLAEIEPGRLLVRVPR